MAVPHAMLLSFECLIYMKNARSLQKIFIYRTFGIIIVLLLVNLNITVLLLVNLNIPVLPLDNLNMAVLLLINLNITVLPLVNLTGPSFRLII